MGLIARCQVLFGLLSGACPTSCMARRHGWREPVRLVLANEVMPDRVERDHVSVVLELLGECIREPSKAPHGHPHCEIVALYVGLAHVPVVTIAFDPLCVRPPVQTAAL